jgi:hypothetical protein
MAFCPAMPSEPKARVPFVEGLLGTPKRKMGQFEGLELDVVVRKVMSLGQELNQGNPWKSDTRPFSALRRNLGFWKVIGADKSVLSWLAYGFQMRFARKPDRMMFVNSRSVTEHEAFINEEIRKHVADGSFVEIPCEQAWIVNPFVIALSSSGKPRRCDDMRYLNAFLPSPIFKMQSLEHDVPNLVQPGSRMFTRDLEKAYYKVPICEESAQYQCFFWKGKFYKSLVLLFGFCQAPFIFTKITRVIVRFFGSLLIKVINFVDDFLFTEEPSKIERLQIFVDLILQLLGWTLSMKDNQFGETVKFLGFLIDATHRKFRIPESVKEKTLKMIEVVCLSIHEGRKLQLKDLERLTGKLISLKLAVPSIPVWLRDLYFCMPKEYEVVEESHEVTGSLQAAEGLCQIARLISSNIGAPFMSGLVEADVYVDSSETGWGASMLDLEVHGVFESCVVGQSSTFRELKGFNEMLKCSEMSARLIGRSVRFNLDSRPAIANLLHSGPVQALAPLVQQAWRKFRELEIEPTFRWVSRETTQLSRVDLLSKRITFQMRQESVAAFSTALGYPVVIVDHNKLAEAIALLVARKQKAALLIPKWEGKSWWQTLVQNAHRLCPVDREHIVFTGTHTHPWEFLLALFH